MGKSAFAPRTPAAQRGDAIVVHEDSTAHRYVNNSFEVLVAKPSSLMKPAEKYTYSVEIEWHENTLSGVSLPKLFEQFFFRPIVQNDNKHTTFRKKL